MRIWETNENRGILYKICDRCSLNFLSDGKQRRTKKLSQIRGDDGDRETKSCDVLDYNLAQRKEISGETGGICIESAV